MIADGIAGPDQVREPARIDRESLLRVHTSRYVDAFTAGTLEVYCRGERVASHTRQGPHHRVRF